MINIVSRALLSREISGPQKVAVNLVKGLDIMKYPYLINQRLDACERLYIHDDRIALEKIKNLPPEIKVIVGPNLFVTPRSVPAEIDFDGAVYIHPSRWSMEFFRDFGFDRCPLDYWPTGIDTSEFRPQDKPKDRVMIYLKQREQAELEYVESLLKVGSIKCEIMPYGHYNEKHFMEILGRSRYVIWIGRQESQGIALQETLAMNVPILVWDVSLVGHCTGGGEFTAEEKAYRNTTSAPYFDADCGLITKDKNELPQLIEEMEKRHDSFSPRKYVQNNLSLEGQARALLQLYDKHFHLSVESGYGAKQLRKGKWRNDDFFIKIFLQNKHKLKKIVKSLRKLAHKS